MILALLQRPQHAPPPCGCACRALQHPPQRQCVRAPHDCVAPSSFLAPPQPFPRTPPLYMRALAWGFKLAELLEHMTEEEALEALGADMLRD